MNIYIDGECKPNPGKGRSVVVIENKNGEPIKIKKKLNDATNNIAEYEALILALEHITKNIVDALTEKITIYTDSKLIWGHINKNWKVNSNKSIVDKAKNLLKDINEIGIEVDIRWIMRDKNVAGIMIENGEI
jgi:ribonuclease HI